MSFTVTQKVDAVKRELALRRSVYPKRVKSGDMTEAEARHEIMVFEAILRDLDTEQPDMFAPPPPPPPPPAPSVRLDGRPAPPPPPKPERIQ